MRTYSPLDGLLPRIRQAVACATVLHPERSWYLTELARHMRTRPSSLQRELRRLVSAGILTERRDGNRVLYQADGACPFLSELQGLLRKTAGLVDVLRTALEPLGGAVRLACVFGSVARGEERPGSDVDLLVVGSVSLAALAPRLRDAETTIGRAINPITITADELAERVRRGDHFIATTLSAEKLFVIGTEDDLGAITGGPQGPTPLDQ